ncbi:DUF6214 family protein [Streptomyces sp. NPDC005573]|uniref:DUF6214 family protein n=1 Tax=Streptomyces sp. NPDC005573 TaxID=3156890 RepID=UPI0033B82BF3
MRLAFPDGACVDALAVVAGGRVSIEDVRARPALSLADLTVLADWIEEPLFEACGAKIEEAQGTRGALEAPEVHGVHGACGPDARGGADGWDEPYAGGAASAGPYVWDTYWGADGYLGAPDAEGEENSEPPVSAERADGAECTGDTVIAEYAECDEGAVGPGSGTSGGARRARPAWPRGLEGCRLASEEYRAAQEQGFDPVLAVMYATGHSRRRSLKLIAQARDAGFLTPRHLRR